MELVYYPREVQIQLEIIENEKQEQLEQAKLEETKRFFSRLFKNSDSIRKNDTEVPARKYKSEIYYHNSTDSEDFPKTPQQLIEFMKNVDDTIMKQDEKDTLEKWKQFTTPKGIYNFSFSFNKIIT